jgi:exodeoxyribonuclease-3
MKIATFNINGVKARISALTDWLETSKPDVALLQEIKSVDENFPHEHFENLGYRIETHGQKGFNGVAILSKLPLEDITRGLPDATGAGRDGVDDIEARYIEATIIGKKPIRIGCLYLPNGNPAPGPKYDYKLRWMDRLKTRAQQLIALEEPFLMAGDYNIIPQPEDVARPNMWIDDALFRLDSRASFRRLQNLGLTEAFRVCNQASGRYSFWDYQAGAWNKNDGIRIDHFLLSNQCADLLKDCWIESEVRGLEKPSDHVPVWVELDS